MGWGCQHAFLCAGQARRNTKEIHIEKMISTNHPQIYQNHDRFSCNQILYRIGTETSTQEANRTIHHDCPGSAAHEWPPLPSLPTSWRSKLSVVAAEGGDFHTALVLQYFPSTFIVNIVSFTNNSKPSFDYSLRLVLAPVTKAQQNVENTGVPQMSQLHQNQ